MGRFCVSCGSPLGEASGAGGPYAPAPAVVPSSAIAPSPTAAQPDAERVADDTVKPAAVVSVVGEMPRPATATITCERCQGACEAGMRFCKFCGAPLAQAAGPRPAALVRTRDALDRGAAEYPPKSTAGHGIQAAIEEAARQAALAGPASSIDTTRPEAGAPAPIVQERNPQRSQTETARPPSPEAERLDRDREQRTAAPTTGLYTASPARGLANGRLVVVAGDGQEGPSFPLHGDQIDIGRTEGTVVLTEDRYMSPRHARLVRTKGHWYLRDLGSTNHVYVRLNTAHDLADSDLMLIGVEVLRFELVAESELGLGPAIQHGTYLFGSPALPRPARLVQRTVEGVARDVYHLHRSETVIGRETGDIVFTDDPYMSRRHALIRRDGSTGKYTLTDLDSSNGTFVAIRGDWPLQSGDSIRVGQHLFRIELTAG